jgi:PilZ domain
MAEDHRKEKRQRVFKAASISFEHSATIHCIVRNVSDGGALLEVESSIGIPNTFTLFLKPGRLKRSCEVVWRSAKNIGIRFL